MARSVLPTLISSGVSRLLSFFAPKKEAIISMVPYLGDAAGKPIKAARNGKRILKLRKEIAELIQVIDKLSPGARKASGKTGDAVSQQMKRVLKPTLQNGERSMTRKQWQHHNRNKRAGRSVSRLDQPLGGTYAMGTQAGKPKMGHPAKKHRAAKTNQQLQQRASNPNERIPAATKFANDPTQLKVVNILRREAIAGASGRINGSNYKLLNGGTLVIIGRTGKVPTVGERLTLQGRQFNFTTGRGFYGSRAPSGHVPGTPTGPLNRATIVIEMTGFDSAGRPIYKFVTANPSL